MSPLVYEPRDVAKLLNIKLTRVYDLARRNLIPHVRLGKHVKFPIAQFHAWLESGGSSLTA